MAHERYNGHHAVVVSPNLLSGRWGSGCFCSWSSSTEKPEDYSTSSDAFTAWERHVRLTYEAMLRETGRES